MATCNPDEWVKLYADDLYKFAVIRVSDSELAQDLVQDTFLSALQAAVQFRGESSEKTWLMAILKHKIIDHFRAAGKATVTVSIHDSDPHHLFFNEKGHWNKEMAPKAWISDINSKQEQTDFYSMLRACMNKLNEIGKKVFNLKYLEEKESTDICKELSITTSNYWVIVHRAKLQLRSCLEKNWFRN
ncbi:MAG: sigma-70 family RNA polymerase sigma factor [Chitinophaga sp.]|uniref:sigma-70 family RNA polymerase sigma factor n=1 Tax=Chitinophaga sp. TaxID=1869181 RepID=UPI001B0DA5FC|nr:sigma-70 family RNA polymerase sigma factor [Chitinophaga sp.]MBO9732182.1 sigma-70 family RNA polymerase sigma factor [Chitinophaga sp.]